MLFAPLWGEGQPAKAALTVDDASPRDPQLEGAAAEGEYGRWPGRSSLPQIPRWAPPLHQPAPQAPPRPALGQAVGIPRRANCSPAGEPCHRGCAGGGGAVLGTPPPGPRAPSRPRAAPRGCEAKAEKGVTGERGAGKARKDLPNLSARVSRIWGCGPEWVTAPWPATSCRTCVCFTMKTTF